MAATDLEAASSSRGRGSWLYQGLREACSPPRSPRHHYFPTETVLSPLCAILSGSEGMVLQGAAAAVAQLFAEGHDRQTGARALSRLPPLGPPHGAHVGRAVALAGSRRWSPLALLDRE